MIELGYNYCPGEVDTELVKLESNSVRITNEGNRSCSASSTGQSGTGILEHEKPHVDDTSPCSTSSTYAAPICRQFWKAGAYNEDVTPVSKTQGGSSYLHIHPRFLHSNATSHKWAFGAIAELLDNAVDEIQNGATFVAIDKTLNPRNGSPALLIQDDGAGMDPDAMRRCLSFGFSDKKSKSAIGKYGNGFKTSSMRLGADAIVFSRNFVHSSAECLGRTFTQSIGLLSYTFLTQSGYDRIVVPMVHYDFNFTTHSFESVQPKGDDKSTSNLSVLLKWSPYSTEEQLLQQFDDVGAHGTKIILYNLWLDNEGNLELDFESDAEDIRIELGEKGKAKGDSVKAITENHIANCHKFSLRAYLSILYVKLPETFCILLRGQVVLYYNIATDLMHPEFIVYKPNSGGFREGKVITTIGFLKEAPNVNVHGFNIYHKNRLILPFLPVVSTSKSQGRGVVGVLEADFIEPTHSKQDFEKTNVFQKLVTRLKDMTLEYWDYHCGLIGYKVPNKAKPPKFTTSTRSRKSVAVGSAPVVTIVTTRAALNATTKEEGSNLKRKSTEGVTTEANNESNMSDIAHNQKMITLMEENKKLQDLCLKYEKAREELNLKVMELKIELGEAKTEYEGTTYDILPQVLYIISMSYYYKFRGRESGKCGYRDERRS